MNRTRLLDKIAGGVITAGITTLMMGFMLIWITAEPEVEEGGYTITIEYDCRDVALDPSEFSEQVTTECLKKFNPGRSVQAPSV
jgi:hypothetical protein